MKLSKNLLLLTLSFFAAVYSTTVSAADLKAGAKKATMCSGCHGEKGISNNDAIPVLAGQHSYYLVAQLTAFKQGQRVNPLMQGIAAGLSDAEIENLAAFFASVPYKPKTAASAENTVGKAKYAMCAGCHGAAGEGRGAVPRLAQQHSQYLFNQLMAFNKANRKGGPMPSIAGTLTEKDMKALSSYLSTLK
jgi:cytochrome c553